MSRLGDGDLVRQVVQGDGPALAELYDRYGDSAMRIAGSVCRDRTRAEDAVQDAFISVWRGAASYRPDRGGVSTWLLQIARNRAIDAARRDLLHDRRRTAAGPSPTCSPARRHRTTSSPRPSAARTRRRWSRCWRTCRPGSERC